MSEELKSLSPKQAYSMMQSDSSCLLVDIRSSMEYLFVGHPVGSVHVPWIDEPDWMVNPNFSTEIHKLVLGGITGVDEGDGVPVILICRSGKRSKEAGDNLLSNGLRNVFQVHEGFEGDLDENHQRSSIGGWRFHQLPWEQC